MHGLGRLLIVAGGLIIILGVCVLLVEKLGLPLGRLPGNISWKGKHTSIYFPLATCLLLSVILSLVLYVLNHLRR
jgi:preprotein translocase subunit SecY